MVTQINIDVGPLLAMGLHWRDCWRRNVWKAQTEYSRIVIDRWSTAVGGTL